MIEYISYEEWGRRIFDKKRYMITFMNYEAGKTFFIDNTDGKQKFATYDGDTEQIIIEEV